MAAAPAKQQSRPRRKTWVRHVQETSNAMDLPPGIFKRSPRGIAGGLKRSVEPEPPDDGPHEISVGYVDAQPVRQSLGTITVLAGQAPARTRKDRASSIIRSADFVPAHTARALIAVVTRTTTPGR
jgi:Protein of unknown function (DUF3175)